MSYFERHIHTVVVHYLLTGPAFLVRFTRDDGSIDYAAAVAEVDRWHRNERGFQKIGYHDIVFPDGHVEPGRPRSMVGAGVGGRNTGKLHVAYVGGVDEWDVEGVDTRTPEQRDALHEKIQFYLSKIENEVRVVGHRDLAPTLCPGYDAGGDFDAWMRERDVVDAPRVDLAEVKLPAARLELIHFEPRRMEAAMKRVAEVEGEVDPVEFRKACGVIAEYLHSLLHEVPWYRRARAVLGALRDLLDELRSMR